MKYVKQCSTYGATVFSIIVQISQYIYKGYVAFIISSVRIYWHKIVSLALPFFIIVFCAIPSVGQLVTISIPQSHFRLQPWETCEMGMGPSVKHVFRIFEWFLPVLPNHSGIVCFFKVPGQLVLWIVIKVDKLEDTRGTPRLTNFRQILLTHFSKSIRLVVWHQPGQMDKLNSICGNLNTYRYWHLIEKSRVTEPEKINKSNKISSKIIVINYNVVNIIETC